LHEAYAVQEQEAGMQGEYSGARIITPAVIIRITLARAPKGMAPQTIFKTRKSIVGASASPVQTAPLSGRAIVGIRQNNPVTGQSVSSGMVYAPNRGGNVVQAVTWGQPGTEPTKTASHWLRRQIVQSPNLRRRIRKVQVLVDGKPCKHCVQQLAKTVKPVLPPTANLGVRFSPTIQQAQPGGFTSVATGRKKIRYANPMQHTGVAPQGKTKVRKTYRPQSVAPQQRSRPVATATNPYGRPVQQVRKPSMAQTPYRTTSAANMRQAPANPYGPSRQQIRRAPATAMGPKPGTQGMSRPPQGAFNQAAAANRPLTAPRPAPAMPRSMATKAAASMPRKMSTPPKSVLGKVLNEMGL